LPNFYYSLAGDFRFVTYYGDQILSWLRSCKPSHWKLYKAWPAAIMGGAFALVASWLLAPKKGEAAEIIQVTAALVFVSVILSFTVQWLLEKVFPYSEFVIGRGIKKKAGRDRFISVIGIVIALGLIVSVTANFFSAKLFGMLPQ
jgi:hypothetical protein